jgi:nickel/cobalt transporter (NiCoT) family protein
VRISLAELFDDRPAALNAKTAVLYVVLVSANVLAWLWAFLQFRDQPILLGTASLAYAFGLRHAVDPDHIAAIDNVTRKLMQEGKRPISAGFFFALGHSTIVVIASLLVALSVGALEANFAWFKSIGGAIGTGVSAGFLFIIALINALILVSVYRAFAALRRGERVTEEALHDLLSRRGLLSRGLRAVFGVMTRSWHMYPLGFLFGLGFDTASEVGLLGISAAQGSAGLPIWSLLIFPALFTAGMSLIDTTDGVLMVQTYGWAFVKPVRKLYYNLTMTLISIVVALLIGGLEVLGLLASKHGLEGRFWNLVDQLNENFGLLGYLIIGIFAAGWLISVLVYKIQDFDQVEESLSPSGD